MSFLGSNKTRMPGPEEAPVGRQSAIIIPGKHAATGVALAPPYPSGLELALFGMGCFWGAERVFWQLNGVHVTAVGYAGGYTPNPTYDEVCSGRTGHSEVVRVVYDPTRIGYDTLLEHFWENHDPTQGMRQGNDRGTQYRSSLYVHDDRQRQQAEASRQSYQQALTEAGLGTITTAIEPAPTFYFAENYHQQYLEENPNGYCGLAGTGVPA